MLPGGAFRALLLLVSGVSAEIVLPPTNLTVSCNNVNVTASWQASRQQPNTRFRVQFRGEENQETTDHRFDLSQFVWRSEERYMEVHSVSVTAILGGNQSETVESETFTFNEFKTSHIKCKLVFPPVDLKVNDSIGTVTFRNPLHFYRELQQVVRKFEFDVTTQDGKMVTGTCLGDQKNCQHEITYPEDVDQCVTLRGRLYDRKGIRYVEFNETGRICPETTSEYKKPTDQRRDIHVILLIVLLLVTFTVVSVIIVFICLTKSWTFKKDEPNLPNVLKPHTDIRKHCFTRNDYIQKYNAVILIKNKPSETPSVSYEDDDDNLQGSNDGSDVHYQYGCYRDGRCLENRNQELECSRSDDDSADDSVKTEERSPYDSPHILLLDKVSKKE